MLNLTSNEKALLLAIRDSEYNEYIPDDKVADGLNAVWVNCLWGFQGRQKFGGTMASLTKKGLASTDGETARLTQAGLDAVSSEPYKCTIDRVKEVSNA